VSKLKAVFFDIDNTLFPTGRFAALARRNAIRAMVEAGLPFDEESLNAKLAKVVRDRGPNYPHHFNILLSEAGWRDDPRLVAAAVIAYHGTKIHMKPYPEARKTLLALRRSGYSLYIVSQGVPVKQWDKLMRLGLDRLFDEAFISESHKSSAFFRQLLKKLDIAPKEAVMVGDRLDSDILPARQAGMRTVRLLQGSYSAQHPFQGQDSDANVSSFGELPKALARLQRAK